MGQMALLDPRGTTVVPRVTGWGGTGAGGGGWHSYVEALEAYTRLEAEVRDREEDTVAGLDHRDRGCEWSRSSLQELGGHSGPPVGTRRCQL